MALTIDPAHVAEVRKNLGASHVRLPELGLNDATRRSSQTTEKRCVPSPPSHHDLTRGRTTR